MEDDIKEINIPEEISKTLEAIEALKEFIKGEENE